MSDGGLQIPVRIEAMTWIVPGEQAAAVKAARCPSGSRRSARSGLRSHGCRSAVTVPLAEVIGLGRSAVRYRVWDEARSRRLAV